MKNGQTRAAHEPAPESIRRGEETAPLRGLGSMDRVTKLDVSGLHGMLDSMGRRAFGNDWNKVRSEVSSWHHLNRIRAALPAMTQHSPLTRTKLSGPNSKTKVSFTADIEQLTYKRTIKTLSSPSMEITEGSASTTERNRQVSAQGALGGRGGDVNGGSVLGEAMAGGTETVRDSERVRDQQRVAVGTKFDQPMAIFEGWVRLDGTMTGSKSTVHESGLFPVEIAIPLTELAGGPTTSSCRPPSPATSKPDSSTNRVPSRLAMRWTRHPNRRTRSLPKRLDTRVVSLGFLARLFAARTVVNSRPGTRRCCRRFQAVACGEPPAAGMGVEGSGAHGATPETARARTAGQLASLRHADRPRPCQWPVGGDAPRPRTGAG